MPAQRSPVTPTGTTSLHEPPSQEGSGRLVPGIQRVRRRGFLALAPAAFSSQAVSRRNKSSTSMRPSRPPRQLPPTAQPPPQRRRQPRRRARARSPPPPAPIVPIDRAPCSAQSQVIPALQITEPAVLQPAPAAGSPPDPEHRPGHQGRADRHEGGSARLGDLETAAFAVGYHRGSGLPGENGNVVLSGHISSPHEGAVFNKLPRSAGRRHHRLDAGPAVPVRGDRDEDGHARRGGSPRLDGSCVVTMITCVPDGIYSHRLVVRAEAV